MRMLETLRARALLGFKEPVRHKGIVCALRTETRNRPVTRHELNVVTEWKKVLANGANQVLVIAAREIGTSDRPLEQHIAYQCEALPRMDENDVSGRVSWTMPNFQCFLAYRNRISLFEPAGRRERVGVLKSIATAGVG
jgi:hypothetical protein